MNVENRYFVEKYDDELVLTYWETDSKRGREIKPRTPFDSKIMARFLDVEKAILALRGVDIANYVADAFSLINTTEPGRHYIDEKSPRNGRQYGFSRVDSNYLSEGNGFRDTVGRQSENRNRWEPPASRIYVSITNNKFTVDRYDEVTPPMWSMVEFFLDPNNNEKYERRIEEGLNKVLDDIESQ